MLGFAAGCGAGEGLAGTVAAVTGGRELCVVTGGGCGTGNFGAAVLFGPAGITAGRTATLGALPGVLVAIA
ncbi:MAG: hypothetical protein JWN02_1618, partial [Acidobacteria bacterium]|nr:hypothetical protein [Acidobacteriota bacterium]